MHGTKIALDISVERDLNSTKSLDSLKEREMVGHYQASSMRNCQAFQSNCTILYNTLIQRCISARPQQHLNSLSLVSNIMFLKYLNMFHVGYTIGRKMMNSTVSLLIFLWELVLN